MLLKMGMVMENVRLKYKNNLINELLNYKRKELSTEELEVLELTKDIYGSENADTLSNMSHQFEYWKKYLQISNNKFDFKDKNKSVVPNEELEKELDNIRDVLDAYNIMNSKEFKEMEELDY